MYAATNRRSQPTDYSIIQGMIEQTVTRVMSSLANNAQPQQMNLQLLPFYGKLPHQMFLSISADSRHNAVMGSSFSPTNETFDSDFQLCVGIFTFCSRGKLDQGTRTWKIP